MFSSTELAARKEQRDPRQSFLNSSNVKILMNKIEYKTVFLERVVCMSDCRAGEQPSRQGTEPLMKSATTQLCHV